MPIPVPQLEQFSVTPMLNAYASGQQTRIGLEDRDRDYERQAEQAIYRAADLADTPEKWAQFIDTISQRFPDADLSAFTDFSSRETALGQAMDPYQRAQLDLSQQSLDLQRQAAARAAAAASQPQPGFTQLVTPEDRKAAGIAPDDDGLYQIGPDNRLYAIGGSGQTINIGDAAPVPEWVNDMWAGATDDLTEDRADANQAVTALGNTVEAFDLVNQGINTGTFANFETGLATLGVALGVVDPNAPVAQQASRTQTFIANRGNAVADVIQRFGAGTGLSDADREYARRIAGGEITMNEEAIRNILRMELIANYNVAQRYNQNVGAMRQAAADTPLPPNLEAPLPDYLAAQLPGIVNEWQSTRAQVLTDALGAQEFQRLDGTGGGAPPSATGNNASPAGQGGGGAINMTGRQATDTNGTTYYEQPDGRWIDANGNAYGAN